MQRFYIAPRSLLYERVHGDKRYHDLFTSAGGAHWIDLDDGYVLLCCDEFDDPADEDYWHAHPEVARLHDHVASPHAPLADLLLKSHAHKQFGEHHLKALKSIGVHESHTVRDVSEIAGKLHPLVRLRNAY